MGTNRYNDLNFNGKQQIMPGITISKRSTDKFATYHPERTKLYAISGSAYGDDTYGWLIMLANPAFGGLEFNIPDSTIIRIPFPYDSAIKRYLTEVDNHKALYGE